MTKDEYREYLNHPLWVARRDSIFKRRLPRCERCFDGKHLELHHKTYAKEKMPWEYPDENFEILCEKCHSNESGFEYQANYCKLCNRPIRKCFTTCIPCRDKRLEELENATENRVREQQEVLRALREEKARQEGESSTARASRGVTQDTFTVGGSGNPRATRSQGGAPAVDPNSATSKQGLYRFGLVAVAVVLILGGYLVIQRSTDSDRSQTADNATRTAPVVRPSRGERGLEPRVGARGTFLLFIKSVRTPSNGNIYLDAVSVGDKYNLTLVVFKNRRSVIGDLSNLAGKEVLISGSVTTYRDQVQIVIESRNQIQNPK